MGARRTSGGSGCYSRLLAACDGLPRIAPHEFVRLSQVYGSHATLLDALGDRVEPEPHDWSDARLAWSLARRTGDGHFLIDGTALDAPTPYGTVRNSVEAARRAGADVREHGGRTTVPVRAGITHTLDGLRADARGRVAPRVWAAGVEVGGGAGRGCASGLAQALVLGRAAGLEAASDPGTAHYI